MLLGVYSGLHDTVSVQEFGIDNVTDVQPFRLVALIYREAGANLEPWR
jgi:D-serine dehydratase